MYYLKNGQRGNYPVGEGGGGELVGWGVVSETARAQKLFETEKAGVD